MLNFPATLRRMFGTYDAANISGKRKPPNERTRHEDDVLTQQKRQRLTGQSRDLQRNFSLVAWAIRKHLDYVSLFDFQSRTGDDAFDADVETLMTEWMLPQNCDAAARHPFPRLLRLAEARRTVDGDVFALKRTSGSLQMIEGDRIRNPTSNTATDAADWFNGVRVSSTGIATQYAVWKRRRNGGFEFERNVAAGRMIQHAYFDRFDQVRGISPLASAVNSFRDVYEGVDYALAKMKVEQLFALVFYRDATDAPPGTEGDDSTGYSVNFGKGPVQLDLDPGDRAEFLSSNNPGAATQEFLKFVLAVAIKALDLPFNFADESFTNYSGSRGGWLLYDRSCQAKRADVKEFLRKVTVWKYQQWIASGELRLPPGVQSIVDLPFEWIPRGMPWWDPLKEVQGSILALQAGLDNPYRITRETGRGTFEDNVDAIARAQAYARERGVELSFALDATNLEGQTDE